MWLLVCSAVVLWASVQCGKLARFAPALCMAFCGAFAPAVGICSEIQQYRARRVLWWLLGLWLRRWLLHPVSISARIGSACGIFSGGYVSGILGGVLGLLVHRLRLLVRVVRVWWTWCAVPSVLFGWRLAPCVSNCDGMKRKINTCLSG